MHRTKFDRRRVARDNFRILSKAEWASRNKPRTGTHAQYCARKNVEAEKLCKTV